MKKSGSLNMETDSNKLWRLTKQLNDEETRHAKITLLQDRKMVHGKQATNIFADTYKEASNIPVELHKQKYVRTEQRKITESDYVSPVINSPLTYEELTSALSNLKVKTSPGPDAITNGMIENLAGRNTSTNMVRSNNDPYTKKMIKQKQKPRATDQLA